MGRESSSDVRMAEAVSLLSGNIVHRHPTLLTEFRLAVVELICTSMFQVCCLDFWPLVTFRSLEHIFSLLNTLPQFIICLSVVSNDVRARANGDFTNISIVVRFVSVSSWPDTRSARVRRAFVRRVLQHVVHMVARATGCHPLL